MPELVPAAKVVRSETQVGHRFHSDRPSWCSGREGTTVPTAVRRSNPGTWQSRPLWGWGSRPLAESSPRTVAELPSPSQPQGVGPAGLRSWEGGAVPTPRAAASRRWPTPSQQGKVTGEWTEPGVESAEGEFWKALGPAASSARGTMDPGLGLSSRARLDRE